MRSNSKKAALILGLALLHSLTIWGLSMVLFQGGWGTGWKEFDTGEPPGVLERGAEKALMGSIYVLEFPLMTDRGSRLVIKASEKSPVVQHTLSFFHSILWVAAVYGIVLSIRLTKGKRKVAV